MTKILVIEDQKELLEDIVISLQYEGYDALGAENGQIGIHLAQEHLPDLVISDIMMPLVDGYGVMEQLRLDPKTANIPIIFLTALAETDDLKKALKTGVDGYLTKPFSPQELLNAIRLRLE